MIESDTEGEPLLDDECEGDLLLRDSLGAGDCDPRAVVVLAPDALTHTVGLADARCDAVMLGLRDPRVVELTVIVCDRDRPGELL